MMFKISRRELSEKIGVVPVKKMLLLNPPSTLIQHVLPVLLFSVLSIFIFRNIIGIDGEIINGDLIRPPELERMFHWFHPVWRDYESVTGIHRLPALLIYLPFFALGFMFALETTGMMVIFFITIEALAGISMYYALRYMFKRTYGTIDGHLVLGAFIAGLAYMWSTYVILQILHPMIRAAFALAPLILMCLVSGLEKKSFRRIVLGGFLWCVACADIHWAVYGGFLLMAFVMFHLFHALLSHSSPGRARAMGATFIFHLKATALLLGSFLAFSAYWFVPGVLMGGASRHVGIPSREYLSHHYSHVSFLEMIRDQGELYASDELFASNWKIMGVAGVETFMYVLGFGIVFFGVMAIILKHRNKYVQFFTLFGIFSIFISTCVDIFPEVGYWIILEAPLNHLYGWAIRTPKISQFILLSLCFLLGFTVVEILRRVRKWKVKSVKLKKATSLTLVFIIVISIFVPNWPLFTGDVNGFLAPTAMPDDFSDANSWLEEQEGDFKVLWLPSYHGKGVDWNPGHRTIKDIASISSSVPTYVIFSPAQQPSGYGIYFLSWVMSDIHPTSLIHNNISADIGKIIAPLDVKYVIFHDDNSSFGERNQQILENLHQQDDLTLKRSFGFIHIFENTFLETPETGHFFTTSRQHYDMGGLPSLATLNSIPGYNPVENGIIFANQRQYDAQLLDEIVDDLVFTGASSLEEVAFSFVDNKYFVVPYDHSQNYMPYGKWSKIKMNDFMKKNSVQRYGGVDSWDWPYDQGVVFTWSPGVVNSEVMPGEESVIGRCDFENGTGGFFGKGSDLVLGLSNSSTQGTKSLGGRVIQGNSSNILATSSRLFPVPHGGGLFRVSMNIAAENAFNVQVKLNYHDSRGEFIRGVYLFTECGNFDFLPIEQIVTIPSNALYCSVQIRANSNPITPSFWWVDDIRVSDLQSITKPNRLNIDLDCSESGEVELYVRCLKGEKGGVVNVNVDGELVRAVNTINNVDVFVWERVDSLYLTRGTHKLSIDNVNGFNAVNLFALVPSSTMEGYLSSAYKMVHEKDVIYAFEAESSNIVSGALVSDDYGDGASLSKVLVLGEDGVVRYPLNIIRTGNYSLLTRLGSGVQYDSLSITVDNNLFRASHDFIQGLTPAFYPEDEGRFAWWNISDIYLTEGEAELEIVSFVHGEEMFNFSFENGWNSTTNAPNGWSDSNSPPGSYYSTSPDTKNFTHGKYGMAITTNNMVNNTWSWINSDEMVLSPGSHYRATMDIKLDNSNKSHVKLRGFNETTGVWETQASPMDAEDGTGSHEWKEYSGTFNLPPHISKIVITLNAGWVLDTKDGNASMYVDNIRLEKMGPGKDLVLDQFILFSSNNHESLDGLFSSEPRAEIKEYERLDASRHKIDVVSQAPFMLGFAEAYDEFWVAHIQDGGTVESIPLDGMLNGFYINRTGNFTIIIEYMPQRWFNVGLGLTGFTIILAIASFTWCGRQKRRGGMKIDG